MGRVRHTGRLALALAIAAGCGQGGGSRGKPEQRTPAASLETRALVDDPIVAQVNGAPVHASCVAAQLRAPAPEPGAAARGTPAASPREGLERCIDFELLAQAAAADGLTADPEVAEAQKREAVRRFTEAEFAAKVVGWDDLPHDLKDGPLAKVRVLANRPELREADYVWGPAIGFPVGSPEDVWAKGLADEVYAALKDRTDLTSAEFHQAAFDVARGRLLLHGKPKASTADAPAQGFARAIFALPAVGRIGPPVRIDDSKKGNEQGGWYVLLLTRVRPHVEQSDEELEAQLVPELRRRFFPRWAQAFYAGHQIEQHPDLLPALVEADQAQGTAPAAAAPALPH
jgi:hypothetical protein